MKAPLKTLFELVGKRIAKATDEIDDKLTLLFDDGTYAVLTSAGYDDCREAPNLSEFYYIGRRTMAKLVELGVLPQSDLDEQLVMEARNEAKYARMSELAEREQYERLKAKFENSPPAHDGDVR